LCSHLLKLNVKLRWPTFLVFCLMPISCNISIPCSRIWLKNRVSFHGKLTLSCYIAFHMCVMFCSY
jgi:hypothetical protein